LVPVTTNPCEVRFQSGGDPIEVFDGLRSSLIKDRSQFWKELHRSQELYARLENWVSSSPGAANISASQSTADPESVKAWRGAGLSAIDASESAQHLGGERLVDLGSCREQGTGTRVPISARPERFSMSPCAAVQADRRAGTSSPPCRGGPDIDHALLEAAFADNDAKGMPMSSMSANIAPVPLVAIVEQHLEPAFGQARDISIRRHSRTAPLLR